VNLGIAVSRPDCDELLDHPWIENTKEIFVGATESFHQSGMSPGLKNVHGNADGNAGGNSSANSGGTNGSANNDGNSRRLKKLCRVLQQAVERAVEEVVSGDTSSDASGIPAITVINRDDETATSSAAAPAGSSTQQQTNSMNPPLTPQKPTRLPAGSNGDGNENSNGGNAISVCSGRLGLSPSSAGAMSPFEGCSPAGKEKKLDRLSGERLVRWLELWGEANYRRKCWIKLDQQNIKVYQSGRKNFKWSITPKYFKWFLKVEHNS
jgi:hypothetical protein